VTFPWIAPAVRFCSCCRTLTMSLVYAQFDGAMRVLMEIEPSAVRDDAQATAQGVRFACALAVPAEVQRRRRGGIQSRTRGFEVRWPGRYSNACPERAKNTAYLAWRQQDGTSFARGVTCRQSSDHRSLENGSVLESVFSPPRAIIESDGNSYRYQQAAIELAERIESHPKRTAHTGI
jgi:hypothetical protein